MFFYEPEYLLSPLEKMLIAFFKMSLSICVSRSSFFKRANSCSAAVSITFPFPGKLLPCLLANSFLHLYNKVTLISNSLANAVRSVRVLLSSTLINLNSFGYAFLCCDIISVKVCKSLNFVSTQI
jgi:hypothetical protein